MGRIHITGGEDLSRDLYRDAARLYAADPRAMTALLASQGLGYYQLGQAPSGNVHVGADIGLQPDGTSAHVEWLPLGPLAGDSVAAAAAKEYDLKPTRKFKPTALVLDDDIAKNLVMSGLTIGGKPVFAGSGVVPCRGFSHVATQNTLSSYVADSTRSILFTLTNIHASAAQVIRGHWVGDCVEN